MGTIVDTSKDQIIHMAAFKDLFRFKSTSTLFLNAPLFKFQIRNGFGTCCKIVSSGTTKYKMVTRKNKNDYTTVNNMKTSSTLKYHNVSRSFHVSVQKRCNEGNEKERKLQLMDIPAIIWPQPLKGLRNIGYSLLIKGFYDNEYQPQSFLNTAEQAIIEVSKIISKGDFNNLEGLLTNQAIREIHQNYNELSDDQKTLIALKSEDIFYRFIAEVGMIFNDETNQRFVEVMVVLHGCQDYQKWKPPSLGLMASQGAFASPDEKQELEKNAEDFKKRNYVCNYRFRREYTKGVEDQWTINQANHRMIKDVVKDTSIFQR